MISPADVVKQIGNLRSFFGGYLNFNFVVSNICMHVFVPHLTMKIILKIIANSILDQCVGNTRDRLSCIRMKKC